MKKFMKKILFMIVMILSIFSFTSCQIDNSDDYFMTPYGGWYWQPYQMNTNGQWLMGGPVNNYQAASKALKSYTIQTTDILADYNTFSLFAWTPDSVVMDNFTGTINHPTYTWGYDTNKKYFDNNVSKYSFMGVLPYATYALNTDNSVDVSLVDFVTEGVNPNDEKYNKEFLIASTEVTRDAYQTGATLNFYHQNSIVRIKFETENTNNLSIIDFTPHVDYQPAQPAVPGTETYTSKTTKFIDELVAGHEVQVGIGFVGASSPKLTKTNPTTLYVGSNNATYGYYAKDWLLSIKDAVNAQFVYYRLNAVANSTSKTETTEDWESAASNKNIFMMKLADGVNTTDFANGDDVFATALKAHQTDWVGGSTPESFWTMFEQAYAEGWRVIRINVSDTNANQVLVFLSNNQNITTQVCEVTGGSPATPEILESGIANILVLPATSANQNGKDAVLSTFPSQVTANVSLTGVTYTVDNTVQQMIFTKPGAIAYSVYSPTNWYTFPVIHSNNFGFTIKFSYTLNGINRYDARVFVPAAKCNWQPGKWYDYVIKVNSTKHGKADPNEADETDPKIEEDYPITINSSVDNYSEGETHTFNL